MARSGWYYDRGLGRDRAVCVYSCQVNTSIFSILWKAQGHLDTCNYFLSTEYEEIPRENYTETERHSVSSELHQDRSRYSEGEHSRNQPYPSLLLDAPPSRASEIEATTSAALHRSAMSVQNSMQEDRMQICEDGGVMIDTHQRDDGPSLDYTQLVQQNKELRGNIEDLIEYTDELNLDLARVRPAFTNYRDELFGIQREMLETLCQRHPRQAAQFRSQTKKMANIKTLNFVEEVSNVLQELEKSKREIKRLNDINSALQRNLETLQGKALAKTDHFQPDLDANLQNAFNNLANTVKGVGKLVGKNLAPGVIEGLAANMLTPNVPTETWRDERTRRYLAPSVVWSLVLRELFSSPFAVFGDDASHVALAWEQLFSQGQEHSAEKETGLIVMQISKRNLHGEHGRHLRP